MKKYNYIVMQNFNHRLDFRATQSNVKKRFPSFKKGSEDAVSGQLRRSNDNKVSPVHKQKQLSPCGVGVHRRPTDTKQEDQQTMNINGIDISEMLRDKNPSGDKYREKSPKREPRSPHRLRSTYTTSSMMLGNMSPTGGSYRQLPLGSHINLRKSFGSDPRSGQLAMERSRELTHFEHTLDDLSTKVLNVKKQLERKNDRHKQQRNFQPRYIILEQEEEPFHRQEQESEISNEESVNTVVKSQKLTKHPKVVLSNLVQSVPKPKEAHGFDFNPYSPRNHNQYYISQAIRAVSDKNSIARDHLRTSMHIIKLLENEEVPSYSEIENRKVNLKRKEYYKDKKTLVFDLDQTLIHCNESPLAPSDVVLTIHMDNGESIEASINIRPYAITLLNHLSKNFQIIVFTASYSCYADVVLDYIDPEHKLIQHRLYRQHCFKTDKEMYIKDLRIINRGLHEMVLIDNAAYSYIFQLENGIPIFPYYDGSNNFELKALEPYLLRLASAKDVREVNKKTFKLHQYSKFQTPQQLVDGLYGP